MSAPSTPTPASSQPGGGRVSEIAAIGIVSILMFAVLLWLSGSGGGQDTPETVGSSYSAGPRGTLALYRWLERSGFEMSRAGTTGAFPPDADTLIMVDPNSRFTSAEARDLRRWVEKGRTLLLATTGFESGGLESGNPMLRELGVSVGFSGGYSNTMPVAQPLFGAARVSSVKIPGTFALNAPLTGTLVLASSGNRVPLAAMIKLGAGRVFVLASDYPLVNEGLRQADNGAFAYNLVQMGGRRVAFDEAHHGAAAGGDLVALLTGNAWGWAIIYAGALVAAYLLWSARRLGPPLPAPTPDRRQPTSNYVRAVAGLFRRARKPGYVAERYLQFFKRTLSRHAELDPYLTDSGFVQALSERGRYPFNPAEMRNAIERLRSVEGTGEGRGASDSVETDALQAIRAAEKVRREALGTGRRPDQ